MAPDSSSAYVIELAPGSQLLHKIGFDLINHGLPILTSNASLFESLSTSIA